MAWPNRAEVSLTIPPRRPGQPSKPGPRRQGRSVGGCSTLTRGPGPLPYRRVDGDRMIRQAWCALPRTEAKGSARSVPIGRSTTVLQGTRGN